MAFNSVVSELKVMVLTDGCSHFQISLTCCGKTLFKDAISQPRGAALVCSVSYQNIFQVVANMQK